jgi:hypothetical protein
MEMDLTPFLCEAFASNKGVHKLIEKLYEKNRVEYYLSAKASKWYNHYILTSQSMTREITSKRMLAILLEGDWEKILQIVRKGWRDIYNAVKRTKAPIKVSNIYNIILSSNPSRLTKFTNDEFNAWGSITILVSNILEKELDIYDREFQVLVNYLNEQLEWLNGNSRFSYNSTAKETIIQAKKLKETIYHQANIKQHITTHMDTSYEPLLKFHEALNLLFDAEALSVSIIEDEALLEKDIDEILAAYLITHPGADPDLENAARFLTQQGKP